MEKRAFPAAVDMDSRPCRRSCRLHLHILFARCCFLRGQRRPGSLVTSPDSGSGSEVLVALDKPATYAALVEVAIAFRGGDTPANRAGFYCSDLLCALRAA